MSHPATLDTLTLCADSGRPILDNVSLEVRAGELALVLGPSGAGKTSLLESIAGLRRTSSGSVLLFGEALDDPRRLPVRARERIAYLFQDPERLFFRPTLREELSVALAERGLTGQASRMRAALTDVGLSPDLLNLPPAALSGGQQRLAALALVVALEPGLLVLDEPTAGLDRDHADAVVAALRRLRDAGAAVVVATHDIDRFVSAADRVHCLARGQLVASGQPAEVFASAEQLVRHGVSLPFAVRASYTLGLQDLPLTAEALAATLATNAVRMAPRELPSPLAPAGSSAVEPQALARPRLPLVPSLVASLAVGVAFLAPAPLWLLAAYGALLLALGAWWGLGLRALVRRLAPVFVLAAMAAAVHLLAPGGDWGSAGSLPSSEAWSAAARALVRIVGPVLAATVFCATGHASLLLRDFGALLRRLPFARRWAAELPLALALVLRLAPGFASTARTFERAQLARGVAPGRGPVSRVRALLAMTVPLLIVTIEQSGRLAAALYLRGFSDARPAAGALAFTPAGWVCSGIAVAALLGAIAAA